MVQNSLVKHRSHIVESTVDGEDIGRVELPKEGEIYIHVDAAHANDKTAGFGFGVRSSKGFVYACYKYLGPCKGIYTAERAGIYFAKRFVSNMKTDDIVTVHSDNEAAVRSFNRKGKKEKFEKEKFKVVWIPREKNEFANKIERTYRKFKKDVEWHSLGEMDKKLQFQYLVDEIVFLRRAKGDGGKEAGKGAGGKGDGGKGAGKGDGGKGAVGKGAGKGDGGKGAGKGAGGKGREAYRRVKHGKRGKTQVNMMT